MALTGVTPQHRMWRDGKSGRKRGAYTVQSGQVEALDQEIDNLRETNQALGEKVQACNDFVEQFATLLDKDLQGLKDACAELELAFPAKATQKDLLILLFETMKRMMLD